MTWMRRGDCPAVFSLEILRRIPCTGEESAPREIGRGIQQISKQTDAAFRSRNTSAPQKGIFIQIRQGFTRRGFKNQNPARGRKRVVSSLFEPPTNLFKNQNPARGRSVSPASPARAGERSTSANHTSLTLVFLGRFPIRPVTQSAAPKGLLLGQVSRGTA